jgi:hypothetical protein
MVKDAVTRVEVEVSVATGRVSFSEQQAEQGEKVATGFHRGWIPAVSLQSAQTIPVPFLVVSRTAVMIPPATTAPAPVQNHHFL